ncbi:major facilitator superfamily domain-containing protein [Microdochium bolleyi]|uniref:Major facilitator superfamily domain-containing protein n=1 Tax=Microdochium bolleyi TaxID=196109 RepID=A0A136IRY8_9PEZI|nr:major facilitator superfamily domain-containing protein [Microdochium bolleyi]
MSPENEKQEKLQELTDEGEHTIVSATRTGDDSKRAITDEEFEERAAVPESTRSSLHSHTDDEPQFEAEGHGPQGIQRKKEPLVIVPRSERRGLFAAFAFLPEVRQPRDYSNSTKWFLTTIIAIASFAAPTGSSVFWPALPELSKAFDVTPTVVNLSVAFYMLSMSIFPLWWSSFSEQYGRRSIYIISFTLNTIFCLLSGFSTNIAMLIICRTLAGGASASVQAVGAGSLADIWDSEERGRAMGLYYCGPLLGVMTAPVFAGALTASFGWESTMWFLAAYGGLTTLFILFGLPETLPRKQEVAPPSEPAMVVSDGQPLSRVSTTTRSVKEKTKKTITWLHRIFVDPLRIILYFRFPAVQCTIWCSAITFGSLYMLNIGTQAAFSHQPYNYSPWLVGLLYIPGSLGYILSSIFGGVWLDKVMIREAIRVGRYDPQGKLIVLPEDRMQENVWIAAVMVPVSFILFGWTVQYGVHPAAPMVATFFFGIGSMLIFGAVNTMLTEFMPNNASSGVALNNFVRNLFTCVGSIIAQPLLDVMGQGGLFTLLAGLCWVIVATSIWLLKKNCHRWRQDMDKALEK